MAGASRVRLGPARLGEGSHEYFPFIWTTAAVGKRRTSVGNKQTELFIDAAESLQQGEAKVVHSQLLRHHCCRVFLKLFYTSHFLTSSKV